MQVINADIMKRSLEAYGSYAVRVEWMSIYAAADFARKHSLTTAIEKVHGVSGTKPYDCYIFRVDTQQRFRQKLQERQKQLWRTRWIVSGILAFTAFLVTWVLTGSFH